MTHNNTVFPVQKISSKQKTEEWGQSCVDYVVGTGNVSPIGSDTCSAEEMQVLYDLYNSIFDPKDMEYVVDPFKQEDGFPAMPQSVNVIKPRVDLLLGEETKRPFNFRVIRTSQDAASDLQDKMKKMLTDYIMADIVAGSSPEEAAKFQEQIATGEILPPEKIMSFISKDYKDVAETCAYHSLNYLKEYLNLPHEFSKGWKDALIAGKEVYYNGISNGEPYLERVNPKYFSHDYSPDIEFIEDGDFACRKMRMSVPEIHDRYYDKISEKDLDKLLELTNGATSTGSSMKQGKSNMDFNHYEFKSVLGGNDNPFSSINQVDVYHACWKSFRKAGFVTTLDDAGEITKFQVTEDYMIIGNEIDIEWKWIAEVWEGYRAGTNVYFGVQPLEYQHVSSSNPNAQKLPYCGVIYNNTNTKAKSLVSIMKPLQYMYIIVWYRLELAMARDKGKVLNMDITQIPKSMNIDPAKWMHYLSAIGVNFINPYECFAPGTKVMMGDYSIKNIEDIIVGEYVMTPSGSKSIVTNTTSGFDDMYKISHRSGASDQIVNSAHKHHYYEKNYFTDSYIEKQKTPLELIEESKSVKYKDNIRYTKRASGLDKEWSSSVKIDPYFLGLWLGDGCSGSVSITNIDHEIISWLSGYADSIGMQCTVSNENKKSDVKQIRIFSRDKRFNTLKSILSEYGILNDKRIPKDFIYTSTENRLKLLAGLIDTDGAFSKRDNVYSFSQSEQRKHIVYDAAFIARSLGFKCTVRKSGSYHEKYICDSDNISKCQPTYTLRILSWDKEIPVKIERKKSQAIVKNGDSEYSNFKVSYFGKGEYHGITIDSNDKLFLLDDFSIVHNCGWDIPGRDGGNQSSFNQISSVDLTMANVINQYIGLMDKIEDMISEISGVSRQRQGSISSSELVGNVERSVVQSAHITESLFWNHSQAKRNALRMLLNTAKAAWKDSGKMNLQYMTTDASRIFMQLSDEFFFEEMDIFISDSTKDMQNLEAIKTLYQPAMQNGATLLDVAEIMTLDNISSIKDKLSNIEKLRSEQEQASADAENQRQGQLIELQNQSKAQEIEIRNRELELEKYKIDTDASTKIRVAEMNAYKMNADQDSDGDGMPDIMEIASVSIKERELDAKNADRELASMQKQRDAEAKMTTERKKIDSQRKSEETKAKLERDKLALEDKKLKAMKELQSMKDKAAMAREQLKAKTALRNKSAGEK